MIEHLQKKLLQFVAIINNMLYPSHEYTLVYLALAFGTFTICKHEANISFFSKHLTNKVDYPSLLLLINFHLPICNIRSHNLFLTSFLL